MSRRVESFLMPVNESVPECHLSGPIIAVQYSAFHPDKLEVWYERINDDYGSTFQLKTYKDGEFIPNDAVHVATLPRNERNVVVHLYQITVAEKM